MRVINAAAVTFLLSISTSVVAANDDVVFSDYLQSAAAASAISSGISLVGNCESPIQFDEQKSDGERRLGIHCRGNEESEASVFIRFLDEGFGLVPLGFEFAG